MKRIIFVILGLLSLVCQAFLVFGGMLGRLKSNPILDILLLPLHIFSIIMCLTITLHPPKCAVLTHYIIGGCVLGILIQFVFYFVYLYPLYPNIKLEKLLILAIPLFTYVCWAIDKHYNIEFDTRNE
jgi:CBS-domain-containing membrane protein